jgi:hypothetical protein
LPRIAASQAIQALNPMSPTSPPLAHALASACLPAFLPAVGTYLRTAGFNWSQRPGKLPVACAANCIVAWHPGRPQEHSKREIKLVADYQQRIGVAGERAAQIQQDWAGGSTAAAGVAPQGSWRSRLPGSPMQRALPARRVMVDSCWHSC